MESKIFSLADFLEMDSKTIGTFTNIESSKEIYNLSHNSGTLLNDCVGEKIRIKKILIRRFKKDLDEAKVNERTGETYDTEFPLSCAVVDDIGASYVTGSKIFARNLIDYVVNNGGYADMENGNFEIKVLKNPLENGRSSLGFEVL